MEFEICLSSLQDIQDFVALSTAKPFPVTVGNVRHRVNGKSFMEMFCLDYALPLTVRCECSVEEFTLFREESCRFLSAV